MLFFVNYNDLLPFAIIYNRTMYNLPFAARRYTYYIIPWWRSFADDGSVFSISKCVRVDPRVYGEMLTVNKITPREKMNRKKLSPRSFPRRTTCETFARRLVCAYNMTETEREGERVRGWEGERERERRGERENYSAVLKSTESLQNKHKRHTLTRIKHIYILWCTRSSFVKRYLK